jgi:hypothetical protein
MTDSYRDLHGDAYSEWKEDKATEYAKNQRAAFMAGFEAAASEGKEFRHLRQWLEEQRDHERERYDESDDDGTHFARYLAYCDVLTKLSEMGCQSEDTDE